LAASPVSPVATWGALDGGLTGGFFDSWWPLLKSRFLLLSSSLTGGVASAKDERGSIGYASEDE